MSKKKKKKDEQEEGIFRQPDGSGLVRTFIGDDLTIIAKGTASKVQESLRTLDIQDKNWIITPVAAHKELGMVDMVTVKFLGHNKGKGNAKNLASLLKTLHLELVNWEVKSNYVESVIPPWLMKR